jgi:hypothetical protein
MARIYNEMIMREQQEEIDVAKQESSEKTALLMAARKAVGEYKDRLRVSYR